MLEIYKMGLVYAQHPVTFAAFLIALAISVILVATLVISVVIFFITQFVSIWLLYTRPSMASLEKYHAYTRSILLNRCPEFKRIKQLKKLPATPEVKAELREIVQSIIDTLESCESEPIKDDIISQVKQF